MKNLLMVFLLLTCFTLMNTKVNAQGFFNTGGIYVEVNTYGAIWVAKIEGTDTLWQDDRISMLVSGNQNEVFDYKYDLEIVEETQLLDNSLVTDFEIYGAYDNSYSELPPAVYAIQNVYGWEDGKYIIVKLNIKNLEEQTLNSSIGLDIIGYSDRSYEGDSVRFNSDNSTLYLYENTYLGIKILNTATLSAHIFEWYDGYRDSDTSYYNWLTGGVKDSTLYNTDEDGAVAILSTTPYTIIPNDSVDVYFAIALGDDEAGMLAAMAEAEEKYAGFTSVTKQDILPSSFKLEQNYPNPFNPSTNITFDIPARENVTLKVFNVLGQEVATLVNNEMEAGRYTVDFNAASLSSCMYIYQVTAGSYQSTKKMTLIK